MDGLDQRERSSARYAAIIGLALLALYGAAAGLWALSAAPPQETALEVAVE